MADIDLSIKWQEIALRRHHRHMAGSEPTTGTDGEISQKLMMEEMMYGLDALKAGLVVTSIWYDNNISKFPDKK